MGWNRLFRRCAQRTLETVAKEGQARDFPQVRECRTLERHYPGQASQTAAPTRSAAPQCGTYFTQKEMSRR
ncbi:hypothetical protein JCM31598_20390 [Desulfonatronum parangueonense]